MMSSSSDMLERLQRKQGPENAHSDPHLAPPSQVLTPGAIEALELAPRPGLVVQHSPANQPSMVAQQPDITHSHLVLAPSPHAKQHAEQAADLMNELKGIFYAGPSLTAALTPTLRHNVGLWLDKVATILSSTPALFENLEQRYHNQDLDPNNPVDQLAERYFDWQEMLNAQPENQSTPTPGA